MTTEFVMVGREFVGEMVKPGPGMLKSIVCGAPAVALTFEMASRSEPAPELFVLMTVNVAAREVPAKISAEMPATSTEVFMCAPGEAGWRERRRGATLRF